MYSSFNGDHFGVLIFMYSTVLLQIKTPTQLEAAFSFFSTTGSENFKINEFEETCGVGMIEKNILTLNLAIISYI